MTTLARRPAPGSPGVFDVPVAIVGWDRLPLAHASLAGAIETIDSALDHVIASVDAGETVGSGDLAAVERLGKTPLLALGMRLGEGTGAALAAGIVKAAAACHSGMATFAQAGVSGRTADGG